MNIARNYNRISDWINICQSKGKLSFSLTEVKSAFKEDTDITIKFRLNRLVQKGIIVSIFKGYYLIIPPRYASKGVLPPVLFIDGLMRFLERNYYVALLNAGALHGAGHQQPQEYFVITEYPVLRPTNKRGIKINYICTKQLPSEKLIEKRKTETGYINISNPILTAIDLINYEKRIGGLSRASTVINELLDNINPSDITQELIAYANVTTLQRFGFVLEDVLNSSKLADKLFSLCQKAGVKFYQIPLKASGVKIKENPNSYRDERWKIIVNTVIEMDE